MKILLLGAGGMIGNGVYKIFSQQQFPVVATVSNQQQISQFSHAKIVQFRIGDHPLEETEKIISQIKPTHVVNCIGMIKPKGELGEIRSLFKINSIFPKVLSLTCDQIGARCIHMSTDCVFSGRRGGYLESDIPDDASDYGRSKFLGEIAYLPHLTIRTSIIGRELYSSKNLLDWFLQNTEDQVSGFSRAMWNGVTSLSIGRIISRIITQDIKFDRSIVHIAGETVSKYQLLCLFQKIFKKDVRIIKEDSYINDKTLVANSRQNELFGDIIPSIKEQLLELKKIYS